jgi:hypothetical protein
MECLVTMTTHVATEEDLRAREPGAPAHSRFRGICSASGDRLCNLVHGELSDCSPQMIAASWPSRSPPCHCTCGERTR